jgi:hypothetical protein
MCLYPDEKAPGNFRVKEGLLFTHTQKKFLKGKQQSGTRWY